MAEKDKSCCGNCMFMAHPTKIRDYSVGHHCKVRMIDYYRGDKRGDKAKKAFLPVHPDEGPCDEYVQRVSA